MKTVYEEFSWKKEIRCGMCGKDLTNLRFIYYNDTYLCGQSCFLDYRHDMESIKMTKKDAPSHHNNGHNKEMSTTFPVVINKKKEKERVIDPNSSSIEDLKIKLAKRHELFSEKIIIEENLNRIKKMMLQSKIKQSCAFYDHNHVINGIVITPKWVKLDFTLNSTDFYKFSIVSSGVEINPEYVIQYYLSLLKLSVITEKISGLDKFFKSGKCISYIDKPSQTIEDRGQDVC